MAQTNQTTPNQKFIDDLKSAIKNENAINEELGLVVPTVVHTEHIYLWKRLFSLLRYIHIYKIYPEGEVQKIYKFFVEYADMSNFEKNLSILYDQIRTITNVRGYLENEIQDVEATQEVRNLLINLPEDIKDDAYEELFGMTAEEFESYFSEEEFEDLIPFRDPMQVLGDIQNNPLTKDHVANIIEAAEPVNQLGDSNPNRAENK